MVGVATVALHEFSDSAGTKNIFMTTDGWNATRLVRGWIYKKIKRVTIYDSGVT